MGPLPIIWPGRQLHLLMVSLGALPAIAVLASIAVCGALQFGSGRSGVTWYEQRGRDALARKDYATARLCYASLLQQAPNDVQCQFGLAQSLLGLGDSAPAMAILHDLAPVDLAGHLPAHQLIASMILDDAHANSAKLDEAASHLRRVLQSEPERSDACVMLARLYARRGQWDLVDAYVRQGGAALDDLAISAAEAAAARNDGVSMSLWAHRAVAYCSKRIAKQPKDVQYRLWLAQANAMLKDYDQTLKVLDDGLQATGDPVFRRYLTRITAIWIRTSVSMDAPQRLALLERGLAYDPRCAELLEELLGPQIFRAATMVNATTRPVAGASIRAMTQVIAAARRGDADAVENELSLALQLQPELTAHVMAAVPYASVSAVKPEPEAAMLIAQSLLRHCPDEPLVHRGQGLVLAKLGRCEEAIPHLETSVASIPSDMELEKVLAECYDKAGRPALAAKVRQSLAAAVPPATQPVDHDAL